MAKYLVTVKETRVFEVEADSAQEAEDMFDFGGVEIDQCCNDPEIVRVELVKNP